MNLREIYFHEKNKYLVIWFIIIIVICVLAFPYSLSDKSITSSLKGIVTFSLCIFLFFIGGTVLFRRNYFALKYFKCPHCCKVIFLENINFICPFCGKNHDNHAYEEKFKNDFHSMFYFGKEEYMIARKKISLFCGCHFCNSVIQYLECPHCNESIDLFAEYDKKEIERKIYGQA